MKKRTYTVIGAGILAITGCSVFGNRSQYEEAAHTSLSKDDPIELREYESLVVVQTAIAANHQEAGNRAFRKLFNYISGHNLSQDKIAMTTPVFSESAAMTNSWQYQFVLPADYTLDTAPRPKDPSVTLAEVPASRVAVIRYAGRWEDELRNRKTAELREWIAQQGLEEISAPRYAAYDPPWTLPALRRNEVLIEVR